MEESKSDGLNWNPPTYTYVLIDITNPIIYAVRHVGLAFRHDSDECFVEQVDFPEGNVW